MAFYVTSRRRNALPRPHRDAFAPGTVWLLGHPKVGRSMALIEASGQSVITSPIQRILSGAATESIYVQTHNSTYLLEQARDRNPSAR